jgi:hypothetical protein
MTVDVIVAARRRTRRRLAVTVLVGAGIIAAAVYPAGLYANSRLDDKTAAVTPATAAVSWPAGTTTPATPALAPDVTWTRLAGVELPASADTGPHDSVGGLARGFAHTRQGALVAAVHLLVRTTPQVGPQVFAPTLTEQVVGEHAAAMRQAVADAYTQAVTTTGVLYGQPLGDLPATIAGIRTDTYTDNQATLSVLTTAPDASGITRYAATTITLTWTDGDWRLVAPPQGRWDSQVRILDPSAVSGYPPLRAR